MAAPQGPPNGTTTSGAEWTEHTHSDGRRYYYNRATKASSWDKPEALKSASERLNTTSWKEYKTADGRDYFFNPITKQSVWDMPIELKRLRGLAKEESSEEEKEDEKDDEDDEPTWNTAEERRNAFRTLLEDKNIKITIKWEEAIKQIQNDKRFQALPTAGERKQGFAEYITQTKKREKEEEREKKKKAKDDFIEALHDWKDMKASLRFKDVAEEFCDKEFWKLIEEEDERDELFQDFMDEFEKKSKDERRKKRKDYVEKVRVIYEDQSDITPTSRWRDVAESLRENDTFRWMTKLEALTSWEEWVASAEKKELELKRKAKFRVERKYRDGFRDLLEQQHKAGKITMSSLWRDQVQLVYTEPRYEAMIGMSGSNAHDLFDDFLEGLEEKYKQDRAQIKKWAKAKGLVVTSTSTYEWFHEQFKGEEAFINIAESHRTMFYASLVEKAKEQDEDAEKAAKKNRKRFVELLQKTRDVTDETDYPSAEKLLGATGAWSAVDDHTRRQCFQIFVGQLKIQSESRKAEKGGAEEYENDSEGDRRKDKKNKNAKKRPVAEEEDDDRAAKKSKKHKR